LMMGRTLAGKRIVKLRLPLTVTRALKIVA
jgi:hypothetical protein